MPDGAVPILEVRGPRTVFKKRSGEVHAVNLTSFDLRRGELLGAVGENGSAKSVAVMSPLSLLPMSPAKTRDGQVLFDGLSRCKQTTRKGSSALSPNAGFA